MTSPAPRPSLLVRFLTRFASSFWFRALIGGGLFFLAMTGWMLVRPIPGAIPVTDPRALTALAAGSLFWGLAMSTFIGLQQGARRAKVLDADPPGR